MNQNSISLTEILIHDIFTDNHEKIIQLLKDLSLLPIFENVLSAINNTENMEDFSNQTFIGSLSTSYITRINTKMETIDDSEIKSEIEYIVKELSSNIIYKIFVKSNLEPRKLVETITSSVKTTCEVNNWNYEALNNMMKFDLMHIIAVKSNPEKLKASNSQFDCNYFYQWNGDENCLKDLGYSLKDYKMIKSTHEFQNLFRNTKEKTIVHFNKEHFDLIIVLFDELYKAKLITPKGYRAKKFTPLKHYSIDLENQILIKKEGKQEKYRIVKNESKYLFLQEQAHKWIQCFKK